MEVCDDFLQYEETIKKQHFSDWATWLETKLLLPVSEDSLCYRCGQPLPPLTYLDPDFYYLPCWNCLPKRSRRSLTDEIYGMIKDYYYGKVLGDRYYQLFIVDPIYYRSTLPHQYSVFKKIVSLLKPPSRNYIWFLDWVPGYPHIISTDNIKGIKIVNITDKYTIDSGKNKIKVGDYEVLMPECGKYELHYSRYSLFNTKAPRKSKRIRVDGDRCYKLYDTSDPNIKSIFRIMKDGEIVDPLSISYSDFVVLRLVLMRNKTYLRLIFDILMSALKHVGIYSDSVFLKNTVELDPLKADISFSLLWTASSEIKNSNNINLSIL